MNRRDVHDGLFSIWRDKRKVLSVIGHSGNSSQILKLRREIAALEAALSALESRSHKTYKGE